MDWSEYWMLRGSVMVAGSEPPCRLTVSLKRPPRSAKSSLVHVSGNFRTLESGARCRTSWSLMPRCVRNGVCRILAVALRELEMEMKLTMILKFCMGEAKSAELIGQAIANNPAFLALRQIEAARETSHTISASTNKVFLDSNDLLLNLQQLTVANKQKK